jgi:thymidylate kinase
LIIEITGIDGSGKSTLISKLRKNLNAESLIWAYERNFKNRGKRLLEHIALMKGKNRPEEIFKSDLIEFHNALEMVEEVNKNFFYQSEDSGLIYFVDKYYTSWLAEALIRTTGIQNELEMIYSYLPSPDFSVLLDVTSETALSRLQKRLKGDQVLNRENPEQYLNHMKECFEIIHQTIPYPQHRINGEQTVEEIYQKVEKMIQNKRKRSRDLS